MIPRVNYYQLRTTGEPIITTYTMLEYTSPFIFYRKFSKRKKDHYDVGYKLGTSMLNATTMYLDFPENLKDKARDKKYKNHPLYDKIFKNIPDKLEIFWIDMREDEFEFPETLPEPLQSYNMLTYKHNVKPFLKTRDRFIQPCMFCERVKEILDIPENNATVLGMVAACPSLDFKWGRLVLFPDLSVEEMIRLSDDIREATKEAPTKTFYTMHTIDWDPELTREQNIERLKIILEP